MENKDERPIPEGPAISDKTWFALALAGAVVTLVIFIIMAIAVFDGGEHMLVRAQTFTPFGAALIAGVTFLTIAWRGVLNTRQLELQADQLKQQADQIAQVIRQNDTKDAEYKAKLLQDAAKLLSEPDKTAQLRAAITSLDVLIRDPSKTHSATAMNMLAEYVSQSYKGGVPQPLQNSAMNALATGEAQGLAASDPIVLRASKQRDEELNFWPVIKGIIKLRIVGGDIRKSDYDEIKRRGIKLDNVTIHDINFVDEMVYGCIFRDCTIEKISSNRLGANEFKNCDFSSCHIYDSYFAEVPNHVDGDNFFVEGYPPVLDDGTDMSWLFEEVTAGEREYRHLRF